jgi:hypothetical protein
MSRFISALLLSLVLLTACSAPPRPDRQPDPLAGLMAGGSGTSALEKMGYSVQVGAFGSLDNAVRFEGSLEARGVDAFYFLHDSGLYKVRFGNHSTYGAARAEAESLQAQGLIGDFFIVSPEDYTVAKDPAVDAGGLRSNLVSTAHRFIGVPYRWGGTSADKGFDCSGLTLVCYRLNGLNLPRVSYNQYAAGRSVSKSQLRKGDLVFFATNGGRKVSHVGMYIGGGKFIHAPRKGKTVRIASLSNSFWRRTYVGGRTYL